MYFVVNVTDNVLFFRSQRLRLCYSKWQTC